MEASNQRTIAYIRDMIFNLSQQHSIGLDYIRQLRDIQVQQDSERFRRNLHRIGQILGYELSKTLDYNTEEVETPMGSAIAKRVANQIILATVLRAGLPVHQGLLSYFGDAENAFIASYRRHHKDGTFEIAMEYATFPKVDGKTVILSDAMIATGSSIEKALEVLIDNGQPAQIHIVSAISSSQGINRLGRIYPSCEIWTGAIDEELTAKSYIVPGLGDAGDLAYGAKDQD